MKRIYRNDVSELTKERQSLAHSGKRHSESTKRKISNSMVKYWGSLPFKPVSDTGVGESPYKAPERKK